MVIQRGARKRRQKFYEAQNIFADAALLRDAASLPSLGTMMRSWCKKHTSGTKNDAHKHDTHDRGEVECKIQHVADYQVAHG